MNDMGGDGWAQPRITRTRSPSPRPASKSFNFRAFFAFPAFPRINLNSAFAVILVTLTSSVTMKSDVRLLSKPDLGAAGVKLPPISTTNVSGTDASVEEQLRNLDSIRKSSAKCELSLEQIGRKLEGIEFRLSRLDGTVQQRMEKMNGTFLNKALKEELAFDQLSRKLDAQYERISRKIGFLESANDRLQTASESIQSRVELQEKSIKSEISNLSTILNETNRQNLETRHKLMQSFQNATLSQEEKLKNAIKSLENKVGNSSCNVLSSSPKDAAKGTIGLSDQLNKKENSETLTMNLLKKITSLYDEFKRHSDRVEILLQETLLLANITKKKIVLLSNEHREMQNESSQNYLEVALEALLNLVKRKMGELEEKIDSKSQSLMNAQQSFMKNCRRLQEDEERIEFRISFVLEKILDTCENRSTELGTQVEKLVDEIRIQGRNMAKNIAHTNSLVVKLDEETILKNKHIDTALTFVTDSNHQIQENILDLQTDVTLLLNETACTKIERDSLIEHLDSQGSKNYDKLSDESELADAEDFDEEDERENEFDSEDIVKEESLPTKFERDKLNRTQRAITNTPHYNYDRF